MIPDLYRERTIRWEDPSIAIEALRASSGIDYLRLLQTGSLPMPSMYQLINLTFEEIDVGRLVISGVPGEEHRNLLGSVHAGFIMAILDSGMGCATMSTLKEGSWFTTVSFSSNFVAALQPAALAVRCVAEVMHRGRRTISTRAHLFDERGRLCAHAIASCLLGSN